MDLLKIIVWPLVVLVAAIIIIFAFKKAILDLLKNINAIKYGDFGADILRSAKSQETQSNLKSDYSKPYKNELVEKVLGLLSVNTHQKFIDIAEKEVELSKFSNLQEKYDNLYNYAIALCMVVTYERIYSLIFGSQITILSILNGNSNQTKIGLKVHYDRVKKQYPTFMMPIRMMNILISS